VAILEVRDKDGNVLEEYERVERKVLETEVARQINNVLTDNAARAYIFGENNYLTLGGRPVAAKTGSTNDYRDAWTIGYTPSLAVGVWVGNNNNNPMRRGAAGGVVAAPIWNTFMRRVLGDTPVESFRAPAPIETDKPVLNGSIAGGVKVKVDRASGKLATNLTPESMVEERTYQSGHSILYFINPEDPLGNAAPIQSGKQFERWEQAIVNWAERQEITLEQPPTEFDDVHVSANQPRVTILNPGSGATISQRALTANVQTSAPRGVVRVEYYIDNILIANVTQSPFDLAVTLQDPRVQTGSRSFRAVAYDDVENAGQSSITLQFNLPALPSALTWTKPVSGTTLSQADFPLTLEANLSNFENINRVDLIMRRDNQDSYINTIRQFSGGRLLGQWSQTPTVGVLQVVAKIINKDGFQYESEPLDLIVN
ncbi:MAG TPA: Ig-like domain-containing protein, partial [Candidatus Saccharimonadales bacterium]